MMQNEQMTFRELVFLQMQDEHESVLNLGNVVKVSVVVVDDDLRQYAVRVNDDFMLWYAKESLMREDMARLASL